MIETAAWKESREYASLLAKLKATVKSGEFVLSSGETSDFFINCKLVTLTSSGQMLFATVVMDLISEDIDSWQKFDAIAGVPIGGYPLVDAVAHEFEQMNVLYVRKEKKDHGTQCLVEGNLKLGMRVVLFEDVVTSGASVLDSVQKLRDSGCEVDKVVVLVDREQGGMDELRKHIPYVVALYTKSDLI